ncbi:hypothetical protein L226DRAFT_373758 [Lentinus tigrinus ALCF2SS1-7]|uniref:ATP-dependent DNA helicase n=1 Tax=Lentinus tigrinus ALCF2SS1-6 TaxID=1328759 RepID=A0A5C2SLV4_9APHY|nr:hypothetical protein L227DRAFT_319251 [Lentinus tigrinus ALCF2SS1-6]RPD76339.1 hypothetical protein L226DRAFT_373758 [Lentinus tigrinus ALCF2SS1-7]
MSKTTTSKQPMSGLRTVKRDFSSSSLPSASQESVASTSDTIPWQPTPPKETKKLSGLEQRLKDIQDALKGQVVSSESVLASSSQVQKRPSSSQNPPAKRRQLPPSWEKEEQEKKPAAQSSRPAYPQRTFGATRQTNATPHANETLIVPAARSGAASKPAPVFLSQEQTHILRLVEAGMSLFYTGSAGAGKSVLLREIIKTMRKKFPKSPDAVAVTASTGIAACNVGGVTIHSFAGIGIGAEAADNLVQKVRKNKKAMTRWLRTHVLIIDEGRNDSSWSNLSSIVLLQCLCWMGISSTSWPRSAPKFARIRCHSVAFRSSSQETSSSCHL